MIEKFFKLFQIKDFCKLAGLKCSGTKSELLNEIKSYLKNYKVAPRYLRDLTRDEKFVKRFEIRYNTLKERAGRKKSYEPSKIDAKYSSPGRKYKMLRRSIKPYSSPLQRISYSMRKPKRKATKKATRKPKISSYTQKWNKKYSGAKSISQKSKTSGVPASILKKVYNKGLAAWRGGAHRPGASQQAWGVARVNSFLTCGKTFYFPDHLLAKEAMKKSAKAKAFWKRQGCKFGKMGIRTPSR